MRTRRQAFTLIEMVIVIAIIGILAMMAMSVYGTALAQSKAHRTRAVIAKIDTIIGEKWEGYRTRQVPIRILPGTTPYDAAVFRLNAIRELQRMEMPDRISDVASPPVTLATRPAVNKQYNRRALATWTTANENAECLYLILATSRDHGGNRPFMPGGGIGSQNNDKSALDYFSSSEIGDTDGDGMNEILDGFGRPVVFLRWAPGYRADLAPFPVTPQTAADADLFDPLKVDWRLRDAGTANDTFALKPLIWSPGPDGRHDISVALVDGSNNPITYASITNDPYNPQAYQVGSPVDTTNDGEISTDNITNHDLEAR